MSCDEIYHRTLEQVVSKSYDYAIVLWTNPSRRWAYLSENNIDDFSILSTSRIGDAKQIKEYTKAHYKYFNNRYMNIKRFLSLVKGLECVLKQYNIPYVFCQGFNTYCKEVRDFVYTDGFDHLIDPLKDMLDFENRPDDYILQKLTALKDASDCIDHNNTLQWYDYSFYDDRIESDIADDMIHPGPKTNKLLFDKLVGHIDQ